MHKNTINNNIFDTNLVENIGKYPKIHRQSQAIYTFLELQSERIPKINKNSKENGKVVCDKLHFFFNFGRKFIFSAANIFQILVFVYGTNTPPKIREKH